MSPIAEPPPATAPVRATPQGPRACAALLALSLVLGWVSPTLAGPESATDRQRAVALFERASELEATSRWSEATLALEEALAIQETPGLRYHLAFCLEQQGRLVAALANYEGAARLLATQPAPDVRELVGPSQQALSRRVPLLILEAPEPVAGAKATLDTTAVPFARPLRLDPGAHEVRVEAPGMAPFRAHVVLAEGERRTLSIELARQAPPPSRPRVVAQRPRPRRPARDAVVIGESVVTGAALTLGLLFTARRSAAYGRARDADEEIAGASAGADACSAPSGTLVEPCAALDRARTDIDAARSVQVPALVTAGVGALATVTTLLVWRPRGPGEPVRSIQMSQAKLQVLPGAGLSIAVGASF